MREDPVGFIYWFYIVILNVYGYFYFFVFLHSTAGVEIMAGQ